LTGGDESFQDLQRICRPKSWRRTQDQKERSGDNRQKLFFFATNGRDKQARALFPRSKYNSGQGKEFTLVPNLNIFAFINVTGKKKPDRSVNTCGQKY